MVIGGRYRIGAPRAAVWAALNDVHVLKTVIPGCEFIEWTSPHTLDLRIKASLGIVHPTFAGELTLSNVHPAQRYTLSGQGKGMLGLAQGAAEISLADDGNDTILSFTADGKADGGVMRLGRALIGRSAQRVIDGFFESIGREMGASVTALSQPEAPAEF